EAPGLRRYELEAVRLGVLLQGAGRRGRGGAAVRLHRGEPRAPGGGPRPRLLPAGLELGDLLPPQAARAAPGRLPLQEVRLPAGPPPARRGPRAGPADRGDTSAGRPVYPQGRRPGTAGQGPPDVEIIPAHRAEKGQVGGGVRAGSRAAVEKRRGTRGRG